MAGSTVLASLMIKLGLDARDVQKGTKQVEGAFGSLTSGVSLAAGAAGFAIGDFATSGIADFARLDTKMREVFTLLPGISGQAKDALTQDARDFAVQFGISTDEAIGGLYQSLSAGVPQDNVFAFMETAQMAATGGVTDLTSAVGLLSAVTKGYGDTSVEATQKASDLAFTTVKLGQTTFPELSASIGKVIPMANALGVSQEELFSQMATLTGVTGSTAEVSTQLKAAYQALLKERGPMTAMLKETGFESGRALVEQMGLAGAMQFVVDAADGNTTALGKMLGSSEALTAVLQLTGTSADKAAENLLEMGEATGATKVAFDEMDSGLEAQGKRIAAFFDDLKLTVGKEMQALGPIIFAFGPQIGRNLGRAFGAAFGVLAVRIPRLMAPVLGKMAAAITGGNFAANMSSALAGGLTKGNIMSQLRLVGGSWGRMLGIGAAAAMGVIILAELKQLNDIRSANVEQTRAISESMQKLLDDFPTRKEAEAKLASLKAVPESLDGVQGAILDFGGFAQGNVLGSALDLAFGTNPAEVLDKQIQELEAYLATDLPETENSLANAMASLAATTGEALRKAASDVAGGLDVGIVDPIEEGFDDAVAAVGRGFGSVKAALANPPSLISKKNRLENMEGRMEKVMRNLKRAVAKNDPINIDYWTRAAVKQQKRIDGVKGKTVADVADIRASFAKAGVKIDGTWLGVETSVKKHSRTAKDAAVARMKEAKTTIAGLDLSNAGRSLISSWLDGIRGMVASVKQTAADIAGAFAALFESNSAPKEGPLSSIDRWGDPLIEAWLGPIERKVGRVRGVGSVLGGALQPSMRPAGAAAVAGARGSGDIAGGDTYQIGILIADEGGLDELDRRMARRRRRTSRSRRLYNDPN